MPPDMHRREFDAWMRLAHTPGLTRGQARRLMAAWGEPAAVLSQGATRLATVLGPELAKTLAEPAEPILGWADQAWHWLHAKDAAHPRRCVTLGDAHYPPALLETGDPPLLLYATGAIWPPPAMTRCVAMVGSRKPTAQGERHAGQFAGRFAAAGWTVVSGLAQGIDAAAHAGALDAAQPDDCATVAVIGTGIDRVYPARHGPLARRIAAQGLILSEYPLGAPPLAHHFPQRNRIIAGLSRGTLVVEAALQSGSLITARLAVEQGREVFALPGSIVSDQSRGCHALIKQGASLVESPDEVLALLGECIGPASAPRDRSDQRGTRDAAMPAAQAAVLDALGADPAGLDELQARTGLPAADLQAQLLELELGGHVARLPGGRYQPIGQA